MADGITITIVGMLTVFAFLILLVLSMSLLRIVVGRFPGLGSDGPSGSLDSARVAAIVASIRSSEARDAEAPGRTQSNGAEG